MELYQLRTFVAVAEEGNLTKGAERVFASQPAVSAHIKALEEELGLPLFIRTPRGMRLTEAGKGLRLKADSILLAAEDMINQAKVYREELTGELTIALNTDSEFLRVSDLVTTMSETHPKLRIKLTQSMSPAILKEVRDRKLDAGFSFYENPYAEVASIKLKEIPIRVVAPASWAGKIEGLPLEELIKLPWIRPNDECPFMKVLEDVLTDTGIEMTDYIEADDELVIQQLVAAGKGLSLLKQDDADCMLKDGTAIICSAGPKVLLSINFVYPKNREGDPLVSALIEAVSQVWDSEKKSGNPAVC